MTLRHGKYRHCPLSDTLHVELTKSFLDFNLSITWCGNSEVSCGSCNTSESFRWLPTGEEGTASCLARWEGCFDDVSGCCEGLVCKEQSQNYSQCEPLE